MTLVIANFYRRAKPDTNDDDIYTGQMVVARVSNVELANHIVDANLYIQPNPLLLAFMSADFCIYELQEE